MTCASCVSRVERALLSIAGVSGAEANLANHHAHITLPQAVWVEELTVAVEKAGYEAIVPPEAPERAKENRRARNRERLVLMVSAILTLPLLAIRVQTAQY